MRYLSHTCTRVLLRGSWSSPILLEGSQKHFYIVLKGRECGSVCKQCTRHWTCRVIIIITIIIITLFTVMKSGAPLLGLAKYIYYASTAYVVASYGPRFCSLPPPPPPTALWQKNSRTPMIMVDYNRTLLL